MPWHVTGHCNHCGICCLAEGLGGFMLENPCITLGEDRCKFYTDDGHGHCLVMQVDMVYSKARDRFGERMTKEQVVWFKHNCPAWPARAKDVQALIDGQFQLPSTCGYKLTYVNDGESTERENGRTSDRG